ncbi:hypothetical protein D9M71_170490 [compost metagenome]
MGRLHRLVARVHQQEAAGAVGILGLARLNAHLAEQCRLLVAGDTGNGNAALGVAVHFRRWAHLRQHLPRDAQDLQQLVVPLQAVDVEHQRARSVGVVGDVNLATRKLPDQPGVDGAEQQFATLGAFTGALDIVEDPLQLGAGEIRVGDQAGGVADVVFQAVTLELLANVHAAPALPDDGIVDRLAGLPVPHHGGFALVGDANGRYLVEADAGVGQGFHQGSALGGPDFHGIVLDPAGLWVDLGEFALGHTGDIGVVVENDGAGTGGALVEGDDVFLLVIGGHGHGLAVRINEGSNWAASCAVLA